MTPTIKTIAESLSEAQREMADKLTALANRCEKAEAYDGRLMAEIDCAMFHPQLRPAEPGDHPTVKNRPFDPSSIWTKTGWLMSRNYWRSVDHALGLISGTVLLHLSDIGADGLPLCRLGDPSTTPAREWAGIADNLSMAVTAAALRARAAHLRSGDPQ